MANLDYSIRCPWCKSVVTWVWRAHITTGIPYNDAPQAQCVYCDWNRKMTPKDPAADFLGGIVMGIQKYRQEGGSDPDEILWMLEAAYIGYTTMFDRVYADMRSKGHHDWCSLFLENVRIFEHEVGKLHLNWEAYKQGFLIPQGTVGSNN